MRTGASQDPLYQSPLFRKTLCEEAEKQLLHGDMAFLTSFDFFFHKKGIIYFHHLKSSFD